MAGTTHHPISQGELSARLAGDRAFSDVLFAADVVLDELDLAEARFERCRFQRPAVRGADFSGAEFSDCTFEPMRIASCKFGKARLSGCSAFDAGTRKGCTFAFCDMHGAEVIKCNFATGTFERCDLYDLSADGFELPRRELPPIDLHQGDLAALGADQGGLRGMQPELRRSFRPRSWRTATFRSCKFSEASFIDTDLSHATMLACELDRAEWDRAKLRRPTFAGPPSRGLNLAVVADYAGLRISDSEQAEILKQLGVEVCVS